MTFVELHLEAVELDETWICERNSVTARWLFPSVGSV
jgi:hypothetical protein